MLTLKWYHIELKWYQSSEYVTIKVAATKAAIPMVPGQWDHSMFTMATANGTTAMINGNITSVILDCQTRSRITAN
jgi:hypothetical protein